MIDWTSVAFVRPGIVGSAYDNAAELLGDQAANLPLVSGAMAETPPIDYAAPAVAVLDVSCDDLNAFTRSQIKTLIVHPWCEGVAQGVGHYRYLSPENALKTAAEKLVETIDDLTPEKIKHDTLAVIVAGDSYSDFATQLDEFWRIFSLPVIKMCARRAAQLARLEGEKTTLPIASKNARWSHTCESSSYNFSGYVDVAAHPLSVVEGYNCDGGSLERDVVALAQKKALVIQVALDVGHAVLNSINGGAGKVLFVADETPLATRKILLDSNLQLEKPLALCFLFVAPVGALEELKGLFSA